MVRRAGGVVWFVLGLASAVGAADFSVQRESAHQARLTTLLAPFGLTASAPGATRPRAWRQVDLDWSRPGRDDVRQKREAISERRLAILREHANAVAPARQRSLELSEGQILVVGSDAARHVRWWASLPDPRLVRYETAGADGRLVDGGTLLRGDVRFTIDLPDDPEIGEVQVFHPRWTGAAYELDSVAIVGRTGR